MLKINDEIEIGREWIRVRYVRSRGPGGQNVNKVNTKAQLRFTLRECGELTEGVKRRLGHLAGGRLTAEGEILIECDAHREQSRNRQACLDRLVRLVRQALVAPKRRRPTRPTKASKQRRLTGKRHRGQIKSLRGAVGEDE